MEYYLSPFVDVGIIPFDDIETCGFIFTDMNDRRHNPNRVAEDSIKLEHQICKIDSEIKYDKEEDFRVAYEIHTSKNYFMKDIVDPKKLRMGFVSYCRDGVIIHSIRLSDVNFSNVSCWEVFISVL